MNSMNRLIGILVMAITTLFFSFILHAEENVPSAHSLSRFCWPSEVNGPLGEPEDTIQDNPSSLLLNGNQAELILMLRPLPDGPYCKKTFAGNLAKFPTKIVLTSMESNCGGKIIKKQILKQPITLMNSDSDETNGRIFWVDDKSKSQELGHCPSSFLMYRLSPIIY